MKKKKGLICFDLDNTLIHSNKAHIVSFQKSLRKHGYTHITNKQLADRFGISSRMYLKELIPSVSKEEIESIRRVHSKFLKQTSKRYAHKIRGVVSTLKKLKRSYVLAIVTNCNNEDVDIFLYAVNLDKNLFDRIVYSTHKMRPKPAPDQIIKAEHLLHLKATYMVGDTIYDILAAHKARVKSIAIVSGLQSRGKLKKAKPFKILRSITELPTFLKVV